jgi:hypothetical protein
MPFSENYQIGLAFLSEESQGYVHQDIEKFVGAALN